MRVANLAGRLSLVDDGAAAALDVETASAGRFGADPQAVYDVWEQFCDWAGSADLSAAEGFDAADLGSPAPAPRQVVAIGLNFRDHAAESGFEVPERLPPTFTKFPSCITGPFGDIALPAGGHTDWEAELVVVIGRAARQVSAAEGWAHVAGVAVGQDVSERITQLSGPAPQFSLGKSFPGFGPVGPWLVTPDELPDRDDLEIRCSINGEQVQHGRTRDLVFSVPELVARLSAVITLLPGDVLFTGTPAGVGLGRDPQRWLAPGDEVVTRIEGVGELRHRFVEQE